MSTTQPILLFWKHESTKKATINAYSIRNPKLLRFKNTQKYMMIEAAHRSTFGVIHIRKYFCFEPLPSYPKTYIFTDPLPLPYVIFVCTPSILQNFSELLNQNYGNNPSSVCVFIFISSINVHVSYICGKTWKHEIELCTQQNKAQCGTDVWFISCSCVTKYFSKKDLCIYTWP